MNPRRSARITACVASLALLGASCAGSDAGPDAMAESSSAEESTPAVTAIDDSGAAQTSAADPGANGATVVPAVLQFSAPLVGGGEIDANELAGKPTAFWFWSPT